MSECSKGSFPAHESKKLGPDYLGFYVHQIKELLLQDKGVQPSQNSELSGGKRGEAGGLSTTKLGNCKEAKSLKQDGTLFSNSIGSDLSDFEKETLKVLLREAVDTLSLEADEMLGPVVSMHRLKSQLGIKKVPLNCSGAAFNVENGHDPPKKQKISACGTKYENGMNAAKCESETQKEDAEVNEDLKFLLENDSVMVVESVMKYSNELAENLMHMGRQLEELLDSIMSKCRTMTWGEKQQLKKSIEKLPPQNLDRVVEILNRRKPEAQPFNKISVNLDTEDNTTLWRLHYYVEAVEKARMLASSESAC